MNGIISNFSAILISTISMSIPLILASVGGVFSVRSGIMALGLESMMMTGAFSAVVGAYLTNNVFMGFVFGIFGGALLGIIHGILSVRYKVNQVISGIGLNLLALAATTLTMQLIWGNKGSSPQVAGMEAKLGGIFEKIPLIGPIVAHQSIMFLVMLAVVAVSWIVLFKTKYGLRLRMVGENPKAASSVGIKVHAIKYSGVLICGALAGLGGAYLSLDHLNMFVRDMTAGRGYIAVVITILARYNPVNVVYCALIFGFTDAIQIYMQGQNVPPQLIQTIPYIATLLVLTFGVKHIKPPAGVQKHEDD
ncbi:MAG: ABC transporter permease [Clostridia bacterium]